ncbi:hypothetical protein H6784_05695 [Candidatus Nomurabacteria bacterium]|nr:hypothetical protein [Candidatus Kaiserbacteria bacterium]MCB9814870.1 hypothetical protein [Candidatus Nomurabacteria bacterium]
MFEVLSKQGNCLTFVDNKVPANVRNQNGFCEMADIVKRMYQAVNHPGYWPISRSVPGDTLSCFLFGSFSNFKTIQDAFKLSNVIKMYIMGDSPIGVIIIFSNKQTGFSTYLGFDYNLTTQGTTAGFLNENPVEF